MEATGKDAGRLEYRHMSDVDLQVRTKGLQDELGLVPIGGTTNES
jgi:hypothetical protein